MPFRSDARAEGAQTTPSDPVRLVLFVGSDRRAGMRKLDTLAKCGYDGLDFQDGLIVTFCT
jgi:hypothetical protein